MQKSVLYKRLKPATHILFWLTSVFMLALLFFVYGETNYFKLVSKSVLINSIVAVCVYLNLYLLFPRYLKQKNYIFYFFWLVVSLSVSSVILQLIFLFRSNQTNSDTGFIHSFNINLHASYFFTILLYVGVTSFLKLIKDWISIQDLNLKLATIEKQKLEAELNTLKSQLNPHFLFNSLNNIYSLSLTKSDKVPDLILKLSDLMRHIIYESKEKYIFLEKELEFVTNFIALQRIRTSENTTIHFEIIGTIPSAKIAPLLFEPFIDNAFKHGLPGTNKTDFINIIFNFESPEILLFTLENNFDEYQLKNKKNSGIGLNNVKQRLQLLYLPHEYKLQVDKKEQVYKVHLELKLK